LAPRRDGKSHLTDRESGKCRFGLNAAFRFGGVPFELAERGVKLFAAEVLPVLKTWQTENAARAAAE
jgi:hypothetical protein